MQAGWALRLPPNPEEKEGNAKATGVVQRLVAPDMGRSLRGLAATQLHSAFARFSQPQLWAWTVAKSKAMHHLQRGFQLTS